MQTATLSGSWEFRRHGSENWHKATVPGGIYGDLLNSDLIDDPYERDNELDVQWVGESDWEYRRTVTLDGEFFDHERITLQCDGLDTVATVTVNGDVVGESDNMFRGYEFDVADALTAGENEIRVRFRSPVEYAASARRRSHTTFRRSATPWTNPPGTSSGRPSVTSGGTGGRVSRRSASGATFDWSPIPRRESST
ncbi:sugar-binding domain-containing protein [Haladaptatus sp. R4]|uniref:glycosyl hydrolase 2 galactose-binding domain-containing protein n=1 Tax=Haladaptatus sp. R4 TaxID=1679489 RepID=UPI000ABF57D9|nr:sugar-binding domain-containing protein [Haladaptatus sp. R4]